MCVCVCVCVCVRAFCGVVSAVFRCLAQLAVTPEGREALLRDPSVHGALQSVAESGLCEHARQYAESALLALSGKQLHMITEGQKHIMLSCKCLQIAKYWSVQRYSGLRYDWHRTTAHMFMHVADQWDVQPTIQRLHEFLVARGYATWFDLTNMKGSTMDAMSDAIEG